MRFPAFQKLDEVTVVAETTPQPSEYEVLRANAIAEQERASQEKLQRILDYTKQTMVTYMSEAKCKKQVFNQQF